MLIEDPYWETTIQIAQIEEYGVLGSLDIGKPSPHTGRNECASSNCAILDVAVDVFTR